MGYRKLTDAERDEIECRLLLDMAARFCGGAKPETRPTQDEDRKEAKPCKAS